MGLFDLIKNWRTNSRIKDLETQLQVRPTPQLYLALADAYKEAGDSKKAAQVLKLGANRFPSAPEISRRQAEAEKVERENEKRRLQEKIQTHPNAMLYARLAELYRADGDIEKTAQVCQSGIKAFPRYGGTYLVLGQVFIDKAEWDEARENLEKCVEMDKYNYMALKLLAQVYMQQDRPADASRRLEDILYFAPGDEAILELLKKAREASGEGAPAPTSGQQTIKNTDTTSVPAEAGGRKGVQMPSGGRKTIVAGRLADQQSQSTAADRDRAVNDGITRLRGVEGVTGALLVDQYGLVVAADLDASMDEGLAGALITNVFRTSSDNSGQLGVGTFEEGVIEGVNGNIHIVQFGDMILAVFATSAVKMGLLEKTIREFAQTALEA